MSVDGSNLPIGGALLVTTAIYAGLMFTIFGPEIADREITRDNWLLRCEAGLEKEIEQSRASRQSLPPMPDVCRMGDRRPGAPNICNMLGIPDPTKVIRQAEEQRRAREQARIDQAVESAEGTCACAAARYTATNRLELALYAGSARLLKPSAVKDRDVLLSRDLTSPECRMEG